jgi:hypothetical protein
MKRSYFSFAVVLFVITIASGCLKRDLRYDIVKKAAVSCAVRGYNGILYDGLSFGNGMSKTLNEHGWVTYVATAVSQSFDNTDSIFYNMEYRKEGNSIVADITVHKIHFEGAFQFNSGGALIPLDWFPPEDYTIKAWFDIPTGHLTRINGTGGNFPDDFVLQYDKKERLLKFGNYELEYDAKGNIIRVPRKDPSLGGKGAVIYEYDLSKTAKSQFYITSGYAVHEYYNLAEVCQWIPVQPNNLRISHIDSWGVFEDGTDYIAGARSYWSHTIDESGFLINYKAGFPGYTEQVVNNQWDCRIYDSKWKFKEDK